jgi:hypothetical protein
MPQKNNSRLAGVAAALTGGLLMTLTPLADATTEDMHSGPYSTWTTCHRVQAEYQRYYHIIASCFSNDVGEFYFIYEY